MIPSTLLQGLLSKMLQGGLPLDKGKKQPAEGFAGILNRITSGGEGPKVNGLYEKPFPTVHAFLSQLKKEFMTSGYSLEEFKVSGEAAAQFGDILVGLGFDAGEVEQVISDLSSRDIGAVSMADLFKAASRLTEPGGDESSPVMLDVSAMPDLEIILQGLGLGQKARQQILSDAISKKDGIDLRTLASGIRRVQGDAAAESGIGIPDPDGIIERIERIGLPVDGNPSLRDVLDELISELKGFGGAGVISEEDGAASGLPGSLMLSYLQQLVAPLGDEGQPLRQLIASAGEESGGVDVASLLNRLVQMRRETFPPSSNFGTAGAAGIRAGASESGRMSLLRFVSILESRIASEEGSGAACKSVADQRPMAEVLGKFMKTVHKPAANPPPKPFVLQADFEGGKFSESTWQPGSKAGENSGNPQGIGKVFLETGAKEAVGQNVAQASRNSHGFGKGFAETDAKEVAGQNATQVSRSSLLPGEGDRSFSENAAGSSKTNKFADDAGFSMEGAVRDAKAGEENAPPARAAVSRSLPGYLLNQVSRQILRLRNAGENEMTLQLKPPHLGRMKLTVQHTAGGMKVGIVVENAAAKDILLANTGDLKAALADQGLRLDRMDVEARADFGQSMAQADREFGQYARRKGWGDGRNPGNAGGVSETPPGAGSASRNVEAGRLDLVA